MAEETKTIETTDSKAESDSVVAELREQLAAAKADAERFKSANDKLSKSEAEMKRQLRARQSAEEQEAEAKAEAQRIADEERDALRNELNHIKAVNAYKNISDEKLVGKLIDAVSNADHNAIATIIANECKKAVSVAEAEWLKERPRVNNGQYSAMTKEQIMSITDRNERTRAIAMNQELFN